jgi:ribose transport system ATP-binding protein
MTEKIVEIRNVNKFFSTSQALCEVDLDIAPGECVGLVGHNGAGKSTLMNIISGIFPPSSGILSINGQAISDDYDVYTANHLGVRTVFQELSLCLNLSVAENMKVFHPEFRGPGWAKQASDSIISTYKAIFPNLTIRPKELVGNMTLGQRQTLEIAKAFAENKDNPLRLLILDEPTSALDYHTARYLLEYIVARKGSGISFVYISHILDEVLFCADRIVVMKDGRVSGEVKGGACRDDLIKLMGGQEKVNDTKIHSIANRKKSVSSTKPLIIPRRNGTEKRISLNEGEIIGLAGLAGHGQTDLLTELFTGRSDHYEISTQVTFIPGDRQKDGILPRWSILHNFSFEIYKKTRGFLRLIDPAKERLAGEKWRNIVALKAGSLNDNILSLSGGNQQKVLFARSLETDSPLILMDDPTRGVDVGTKEIIYSLISLESAKGRGFVWYTTEMNELKYCDRVYIFKSGHILTEIPGCEATEEVILKASF